MSMGSLLLASFSGVGWRRRRDVLLGVALGLAIHFWRDLAEPGSHVELTAAARQLLPMARGRGAPFSRAGRPRFGD